MPTISEKYASDLRHLEEEHTGIRRRYARLENAILYGQGLPRILEAADSLVLLLLLHLAHEKHFLAKLPVSSRLQEKNRKAYMELTAQLFGIAAELEQQKTSAVFLLLRLGRLWMNGHMNLENEEFQCEASIRNERTFLASQVLGDHATAMAGLNR